MALYEVRDVLGWIADYACRYRLDDIIKEMYEGAGKQLFSTQDVSHIHAKQALIWLNIKRDWHEDSSSVEALSSLVNLVKEKNSVNLYARLSLGLRLKEVVHSLTEKTTFYEKLKKHFPGGKFRCPEIRALGIRRVCIDDCHFKRRFSAVWAFLTTIAEDEEERKAFLAKYKHSDVGITLTEGLLPLCAEFFDKLLAAAPQLMLEQIVTEGVHKFVPKCSENCGQVLSKALQDVHKLEHSHVRSLMWTLIDSLHSSEVPHSHYRTRGKGMLNYEFFNTSGTKVFLKSKERNSSQVMSASLSTCVPSSHLQEHSRIFVHHVKHRRKSSRDERLTAPDLCKFLKRHPEDTVHDPGKN